MRALRGAVADGTGRRMQLASPLQQLQRAALARTPWHQARQPHPPRRLALSGAPATDRVRAAAPFLPPPPPPLPSVAPNHVPTVHSLC